MWSGLICGLEAVEIGAFVKSTYGPLGLTKYGCASDTGMVVGRNEWPYSLRTVTESAPSAIREPRLVKIWMTPLAASDPYSDEAAAPFTISMWSMSSELMSAREWRAGVPAPPQHRAGASGRA